MLASIWLLAGCGGNPAVSRPTPQPGTVEGVGATTAVGAGAWGSQQANSGALPREAYFLPTAVPLDASAGDLAEACRQIDQHFFLGTGNLNQIDRALAPFRSKPAAQLTPAEIGQFLRLSTWQQEFRLRLGRYEGLLEPMNTGIDLAKQRGVSPELMSLLYFQRGAARLKLAEAANCAVVQSPYMCLISTQREGRFVRQEDLLAAADDFTTALTIYPSDSGSQWLLNIAHMLLGTYPDGVPPKWLIPPSRFGSGHEVPRFQNIAQAQGMANVDSAGSAVMEDLDNDGLLDILTSTLDPCRPVTYYHNGGDGHFADYTKRAGLAGQLGAFNVQQTDYNNDGWIDLFFTRGGWQSDSGRVRTSLLRNNGDGTFTDVTAAAGLASPAYPTQASAWADYDGDGDLDLFIGNEINNANKAYPSQLYRNNGDGTFTDVAKAAGVSNDRMAKGAAWGDFDNDADPDLYVSNSTERNRLYRNNGDGTFTDLAPELGVTEPVSGSFATWFFDYDNDGWQDVYVAGYSAVLEAIARDYMGDDTAPGSRPRLYHNNARGGFEDVTRAAGLHRVLLPMGVNFGDIDNDGWLDMYLGTGNPLSWSIMPNVMYRNDGGERFVDVSMSANVGHLPKGHGIAFGDVDNDGDQDIYLQAGGFGNGDASPNAFFLNPGAGNHWLTIKVVGVRSNRPGIGARIKLTVEDGGRAREIHAEVTSGGSFGSSSLQQEIGLGQATRVRALEISWPTTGIRQTFTDIAADQAILLREGAADYEVLAPQRLELAGASATPAAQP